MLLCRGRKQWLVASVAELVHLLHWGSDHSFVPYCGDIGIGIETNAGYFHG
jgi:hypothetical protein